MASFDKNTIFQLLKANHRLKIYHKWKHNEAVHCLNDKEFVGNELSTLGTYIPTLQLDIGELYINRNRNSKFKYINIHRDSSSGKRLNMLNISSVII